MGPSEASRAQAEGIVALGADLYDGRIAPTVPEARSLRAKVSASRREPVYRYLIRMIGDLQSEAPGDVALLGFSMGGHWVSWLSQRPELDASKTVTFYATRDGDYSTSRSAFLAHFAETDDRVSSASIRKLESSLGRAGREHSSHTCRGTAHWFFESDRPEFDREASALAWQRTLTFLRGAG